MAILSAILSLLSKKLGDLLQAVFGWSITGLFGRLPRSKQTAVAVALILSIAWPLLIAGAVVPSVADWAIALVPLHEWIRASVLRIVWTALAVLAPIVVGMITAAVAPARHQKHGLVATVLSGYPIALGFLVSFLITLFVVPALKIAAMARGWSDEHVYVQVRAGSYEGVLAAVRRACGEAGLFLDEERVPGAMRIASRALLFFARASVAPLVESEPRRLRNRDVELYLYPGDLLVRGKPTVVARVRAALLVHLVRAPAHLVEDPKAQRFEDQIAAAWQMIDRHAPRALGAFGRSRVRELGRDLDHLAVPYGDWVLLYTNLHLLERAVAGGPRLVDDAPPRQESDVETTVMRPSDPARADAADLVREAIVETKTLLALEVELAKAEMQKDLRAAKTSGIAFGAALVAGIAGVTLLLVAVVLAIAPRPAVALVAAAVVLAGAAAAAWIGWSRAPKHPLEHTRERLMTDVHIVKERLA